MKRWLAHFALLGITLISVLLSACGGGGSADADYSTDQKDPTLNADWVIEHALSDPTNINPITYTDAGANYIIDHMFQQLLAWDHETYELAPELAKSKPEVSEDGLRYTFEIFEDAMWDDGKPITGYDYAFTIKVIKNPNVDCQRLRPYFEFIEAVEVDEENPRKFTVVSNKPYYLAESSIATQPILPKHFYDPEGVHDNFSIAQLNRQPDQLAANAELKQFAERFNSPAYQREKENLVGSGAYRLQEWVTGQQIVLVRKEKYWGDNHPEIKNLQAYPAKLVYKVVNEVSTAITDLKGQKIDVMRGVPPRMFARDLQENDRVKAHFTLNTPDTYFYGMVALNNRPPKSQQPYFVDRKVRRAMAHLFDVQKYIENLLYGFGKPIIGPVSPLHKGAYNDTLDLIAFNLDKAKQLLSEAGWEDSNNDGTRDKMINGQKVEFKPTILVNSGNDVRKNLAILLREEAKKVGVSIEVQSVEWNVFVERMKKHEFDMYVIGWSSDPSGGDLRQLWHTNQHASGSNYLGFGTPESDRLLEEIAQTVDDKKRNDLIRQFQEILYREQPCIFTTAPKARIVIHKRFQNAETSPVRPGYQASRFWTPKEHVMYQ